MQATDYQKSMFIDKALILTSGNLTVKSNCGSKPLEASPYHLDSSAVINNIYFEFSEA